VDPCAIQWHMTGTSVMWTSGEAVGRLGEEKVGVTAGMGSLQDLWLVPIWLLIRFPVPGLVGVDWDAADMV